VIKPSFGNIPVWKSIFQADGQFFVDSMGVGIASKVYEGVSISKLNLELDFLWLIKTSQQAKDIKRFDHFSNGYSALNPSNSNRIINILYSFVPNEIRALFQSN
jgi:inner membrane protein